MRIEIVYNKNNTRIGREPFVEALCTSSNTLLASTSSAVRYTPLVDATAVTLACE